MRGVNKVILVGTLGRDPETKTFQNGGSLTTFSIATSESWTDKMTGERREQTEWHRIVLSNRLGEVAQQYLRKGSKVYIEGSLRTRQWTDQNGQERYSTEIRGDSMQMLDSRPQQYAGDDGYASNGGFGQPRFNQAQAPAYPQNNGYNQGNYQSQGGYNTPNQGYNQNYNQNANNNAGQEFNAPVNHQPTQNYSADKAEYPANNDMDDDLPF